MIALSNMKCRNDGLRRIQWQKLSQRDDLSALSSISHTTLYYKFR